MANVINSGARTKPIEVILDEAGRTVTRGDALVETLPIGPRNVMISATTDDDPSIAQAVLRHTDMKDVRAVRIDYEGKQRVGGVNGTSVYDITVQCYGLPDTAINRNISDASPDFADGQSHPGDYPAY